MHRLAQEERVDRGADDGEGQHRRGNRPHPAAERRQARAEGQRTDASSGARRQQRVLPPRKVAEEDDRQVCVVPHRPEQIRGGERRRDGERHEERDAHPRAAGEHAERERRQHAGDAEHGVETQKQQQPEQRAGDRREESVAVDVRARVREQRRKEQRLHHHLGVRVAREPDLRDVERQERRRRPRRRRAGQAAAGEVHREHAENRPHADRAPRAGQAVEAVADGDGRRKEVRKLADDRTGVRVLDEEPHEPEAVVVRSLVGRKEEVARERRHRRDDGIAHDDRASLRDLNPFVHVHAGILAADDVFRRREEAPEPKQDERRAAAAR